MRKTKHGYSPLVFQEELSSAQTLNLDFDFQNSDSKLALFRPLIRWTTLQKLIHNPCKRTRSGKGREGTGTPENKLEFLPWALSWTMQ